MPLVSVVVAVYNIEKYIEICIQSLLKQTYDEMEILLIDDGSQDESGSICDKYAEKDSRIRVLHKQNGGLSDVRNVGIQEASGKYLMYVDGDDTVSENFVEAAVSCAERFQTDIGIFDFQEIEEDTGRVDRWSMRIRRNELLNAENDPEILLTTPCAWNKIYRLDFLKESGLSYPLKRHYEDLTVTPVLLALAKRIVYLDSGPLYDYMLRDGSIMRSHDFRKNYEDRTAAVRDVLRTFREKKIFEPFQKELEFLTFEHVYFMPMKEILMYEPDSVYQKKFRAFALEQFPDLMKNPYIRERLSPKDQLIWRLMKRRLYFVIRLLSRLRKKADSARKRGGAQ